MIPSSTKKKTGVVRLPTIKPHPFVRDFHFGFPSSWHCTPSCLVSRQSGAVFHPRDDTRRRASRRKGGDGKKGDHRQQAGSDHARSSRDLGYFGRMERAHFIFPFLNKLVVCSLGTAFLRFVCAALFEFCYFAGVLSRVTLIAS